MFHEIGRLKIAFALGLVAYASGFPIRVILSAQVKAGSHAPRSGEVILTGHVLAAVDTMLLSSDLNCRYERFVFGAESADKEGKSIVLPVEISHAYYVENDSPFPRGFYDYSKLYELHVTRTCGGDETVNDLAYDKLVDETTGKALPPRKALRFLKGAPGNLLEPDLLLPCYVLYSDGYKVVRQGKQPASPPKIPAAKP